MASRTPSQRVAVALRPLVGRDMMGASCRTSGGVTGVKRRVKLQRRHGEGVQSNNSWPLPLCRASGFSMAARLTGGRRRFDVGRLETKGRPNFVESDRLWVAAERWISPHRAARFRWYPGSGNLGRLGCRSDARRRQCDQTAKGRLCLRSLFQNEHQTRIVKRGAGVFAKEADWLRSSPRRVKVGLRR